MQACAVLWIVALLCAAAPCDAFLIRRSWNPDGTVEDLIDIPDKTKTDDHFKRDERRIFGNIESSYRDDITENTLEDLDDAIKSAGLALYHSLMRSGIQGKANTVTKRGTDYSLNDLLDVLLEMYGSDEIYHVGRAHPMRFGAGKR